MASRPFFQVFLYLYTIFAGPAVMAKTGFPSFPIHLECIRKCLLFYYNLTYTWGQAIAAA